MLDRGATRVERKQIGVLLHFIILSKMTNSTKPRSEEKALRGSATRLELRLGERLAQDLDELAESKETTKSEIIKRAIALYARANIPNEEGKKSKVILEVDGIQKEIIVL